MTNEPDSSPKTAAETMAELVAKKRAARGQGRNPTASDDKARKAAAARSASKSKPALRK